jgi:DNA polymerase-3 subunit delta'
MVQTKLTNLWQAQKFPSTIIVASEDIESDFIAIQAFINNIYLNYSGISYENNTDVMTLMKQEGKSITIEQVLSLNKWLYQTSGISPFKFLVIYQADLLNINASNACLKILEEPPIGLHSILLTTKPNNLLITIRSRCYKIHSYKPYKSNMESYQKFLSILNSTDSIIFDYCSDLKSEDGHWQEFIGNIFLLFNRWMKFTEDFQEKFNLEEYKFFNNRLDLMLIDIKLDQIKKLIADTNLCNLDYVHSGLLIMNKIKE